MKIRACHPHNFKTLLEFNEEKKKFDGSLGNVVEESFSLFFDKINCLLPNVSAEIQADNLGVGEYKEQVDRYDGCLGQIQMNQSDVMMQFSAYPMDIENVTQGMTVFETSLSFASGYNKTLLLGSLQVLDSVNAFSSSLWIMCCFTWLFMVLFLSTEEILYQWVRRLLGLRRTKHNSSVYQVATHLMRRGTIHPGRFTRRLVFMSASLFSLVVIHYFCSLMKTELVVVKDPLVYNSYNDIIDRKAIPLFVRGMSHDLLFKKSNSRAHRHKLWQYASKSFGKDRLYLELTPFLFLLAAISVINQNVVVILEEAIMPVVITSGCSLAGRDPVKMAQYIKMLRSPEQLETYISSTGAMDHDEMKLFINYARANEMNDPTDLLVHTSKDPRDEKFIQGLIFNSNADAILLRGMQRAIRRLMELGLALEKRKSLEKIDMFKNHAILDMVVGKPLKKRRSEVGNCKSKSIVKPTVKMQAIRLENMRSLFTLVAVIYLLLSFLLVTEVVIGKLDRTLKKKKIVPM